MNPTHVVLVFTAIAAAREIRLAITWRIALCSKSPVRRKVAFDLIALMLTPYWRRSTGSAEGRSAALEPQRGKRRARDPRRR